MFNHIRRLLVTLVLATGSVLLFTVIAQAQARAIRFVTSKGNDANACTQVAPCRTLQRAVDLVSSGGEVQILDSGDFGASLSIRKSVTISAVGVSATIGNIVINRATAVVVLRGLMLTGALAASGTSGILISNAAAVHIVGCQVERFQSIGGITIDADNADVFISDTFIRSNTINGLILTTASSGARLTIDNSRFENNGFNGIAVVGVNGLTAITRVASTGNANNGILHGLGRLIVTSTTVANNGLHGFEVANSGNLNIEMSVVHGNAASGLRVTGGSIARVSNSAFTVNATGLQNESSTLLSRGNNTVSGNTTNTSGAITPLAGI